MSTNAGDKHADGAAGSGAAAATALQAPRLRSAAHYAAWRPDMEVWLERNGAHGVHTRPLTAKKWMKHSGDVRSQKDATIDAAMALLDGDDSSSAAAGSAEVKRENGSAPAASEAVLQARKVVAAMVDCSQKIYGAIYSALPDEIKQQVASVPRGFAYGLWMWLENKYQSTERDHVGELLSQWIQLSQDEDETYDAYRARVDKLGTLLEQAKEKPSAAMYSLIMLDKLQPRHKPAVLALKAGGQLKDLDKVDWDVVATFMNTHEREEIRQSGSDRDGHANAVWANLARGKPMKPSGNIPRDSDAAAPSKFTKGQRPLSEVQCYKCQGYGHVQRYCTEERKATGGAPRSTAPQTDKKFVRKVKFSDEQASAAVKQVNIYAHLNSDEEEDSETVAEGIQRVSMVREEIVHAAVSSAAPKPAAAAKPKRLMTERQREELAKAKAAPARKPEAKKEEKSAAQLKPRNYAQLDTALASDAWGWDTMASVCISGNRTRFTTLRKCPAVQIKTADGSIVTATQQGTVVIRITTDQGKNIRLAIDNVLFHERFASNLLSGERLTKQLGWEYHSTQDGTHVVTPGGNKITLSTRGRISVMLGAGPERVYASLVPGSSIRDDVPKLVELHSRLGHMGFDSMVRLIKSGRVDGLGVSLNQRDIEVAREQVRECRACFLGKHARTSFDHRGLLPGTAPIEHLHMDSYVVKCDGRNGMRQVQYGVVVTDTYSRAASHIVVPTKDLIADEVINLFVSMQRQWSTKIKRVFCDGGSEFINQKLKGWLAKEGILIRVSPPNTQQLDGVAERNIRTFKDRARTMIHEAGASEWMWKHAVTHATWLWNRVRISIPTGVTPYEKATGRVPSVNGKYIGVWGSDCWVHQRKEVRPGAMAPKSEPGIYLGHTEEHNAALVLLVRTGKRVVTRDLKFCNRSFEHMKAYKAGEKEIPDRQDDHSASTLMPSGSSSEILQVQGGEVEPLAADGELKSDASAAEGTDETSDPDEWQVEKILQRRVVRGRNPQYKVRWSGFSAEEDTWEPEVNVKDCMAMEEFLKAHPEVVPTRRSARLTSETVLEHDATEIDDKGDELRVEMAMSALRGLQTTDEQPQDIEVVMNAVSAGVDALRDRTPNTLKQAEASPDRMEWRKARQKEYDSCIAQGVWDELPRSAVPMGKRVLPCKDVFKIKVDELGNIVQFKARFTPMGNFQKEGIDFNETFARTGMYKTERVCLSLASRFDHELVQFDVPTAFLNANVEEEVYMAMPAGFGKDGMVCRLKKSLYGLRQAPRNWDRLVHGFITRTMRWKATVSDPSLYFKRSKTGRLMLIYRFVDDMQGQHHKEDEKEFDLSSAMLRERFNIKKMENASWMLGMRITRDRKARTIKLDQELYITKALERYGLAQCKVANSPEVPGAANDTTPSLDVPADRQRYMEIVGTLMYAAISTRPDIAHAVHYLASNMQAPKLRHMNASERVLRYLAGTKSIGLVFGSRNGDAVGDSRGHLTQQQVDVCAYADADYANDKGDRKSVSGWVAKLNGDPVSWSAKKQRVVAQSTCESELYAEAAAIQEVLWLRGILAELGLQSRTGSVVYGDNQSTIAVSKNGIKGERTKHVDVKYHFITETVESGQVKLQWVPTSEQQADIFTKALAAPAFLKLRGELMSN